MFISLCEYVHSNLMQVTNYFNTIKAYFDRSLAIKSFRNEAADPHGHGGGMKRITPRLAALCVGLWGAN